MHTSADESIIAIVEGKYPRTTEAFKRIAGNGQMYALFCRKQMDYGPENIRGGNDLSSMAGRMMSIREVNRRAADKQARIANLTLKSIKLEAIIELRDTIIANRRLFPAIDDGMIIENWVNPEIQKYQSANESLEDSMIDIATYAVIMLIVHEGAWGQ